MASLSGIRVIDLSRVLAGPLCTQILGDLGAEIIKIEKPGAGDDTRYWGPPFLKDKDGHDTTESAYYLSVNRNKKSVAIDIANPEGQNILHALLQDADIIIENFKVGGLEKYGLGYAQLKDKYPHLIYCAISGFGQQGPLAREPGYDFVAQAMSGFMASTGRPSEGPTKAGVAISDVISGLYAAIGILAALQERGKTGVGQMVDVALLDCTMSALTNLSQYYLTSGKVAPRLGNAHSTIVPYQMFDTKDGHVVVAVGNDSQFKKFCAVGGVTWCDDSRYAKNTDRVRNRETLVPLIIEMMKARTTAEWVSALRDADVPVGPVNKMDQAFAEEQLAAREMKIQVDHPFSPTPVDLVGNPIKLSAAQKTKALAPPVLGQHTDEVLKSVLGLPDEDLAALEKNAIIQRHK